MIFASLLLFGMALFVMAGGSGPRHEGGTHQVGLAGCVMDVRRSPVRHQWEIVPVARSRKCHAEPIQHAYAFCQ